jgi:cutinase-like protein
LAQFQERKKMAKVVRLACFFSMISAWAFVGGWIPHALGSACPSVEVVFARGTSEAPGVGGIGQDFVNALSLKVGPVGVYAIDYPANMDFGGSAMAGINDAASHIQQMATSCPATHMVLGGYSQGAAVAGFVTSAAVPDGAPADAPQPMSSQIANHIAAVVLFGTPSVQFMGMIGQPPIAIGGIYQGKTIQLCIQDDPICSQGTDWAAHSAYTDDGMVAQAATFAASRI